MNETITKEEKYYELIKDEIIKYEAGNALKKLHRK